MLLSIFTGMTYQKGAESSCFNSVESLIIATDTGTDILAKIYIPAYVAELQVSVQDFTNIVAGFFIECDFDKLFVTATHLATFEGLGELAARLAGAYPYEVKTAIELFSAEDGEYTTAERGYAYGRVVSTFFNYTI